MRQVYHNEVILIEPATPGHYVYDDPVDPGKVLLIRNLAVTWSDIAITESGQFFIQDGGRKIFLRDDLPSVVGGLATWKGLIYCGEGDRPGVYVPDSAEDDVIHFFVSGELWDLADFRR